MTHHGRNDMRIVGIVALAAMTFCAGGAFAQNIPGSEVPVDKTHVFKSEDLQGFWKQLEARSPASCAEGSTPCKGSPGSPLVREGFALTLFVRVARASDLPRTMPLYELWFVTAGSATAVTGGKLINPRPATAAGIETIGDRLEGGVEAP